MGQDFNGQLPRDTRILIVEDEIIIALDLEDMFRAAGAVAVERCSTVQAAFSAIHERIPTVAVLDFRLGSETTEGLIDLLVDGDVPFIVYSGQPVPSAILKRAPHAVLIPKPERNAFLVQAIADLLGR